MDAEPAGETRPAHAERFADLTAGRSRQDLRQRDEGGVDHLVEPTPLVDELGAELAEMRDRSAERGQAVAQKGGEDLPG